MQIQPIPAPPNWKTLAIHPLAAMVDFGVGIDLMAFADFVRNHGYDPAEPIILYDGKILDGRHRHYVCTALDITPTFALFTGPSALAYVGKKHHRQHATPSQRALLWARLRQLHNTQASQPPVPRNAPAGDAYEPPSSFMTAEQAARNAGVSTRTLARAEAVLEAGDPAVLAQVQNGECSLRQAADQTEGGEVNLPTGHVNNESQPAPDSVGPGKYFASEVDREEHRAKCSRNGREVYNYDKFNAAWRTLVREIDTAGKPFAKHNSPEAEGLRRQLKEFKTAFTSWFKKMYRTEFLDGGI